MISRRRFATCAICAAGGVLGATIGASAQAPGFTRTVLNRAENPGTDLVTIQVLVEIEPGILVARHTHPGVESGYFLEGVGMLGVAGQADRQIKAGEGFVIPYEIPHLVQNGPARMRVLSTYVVDKNKPLATPAPA